MKTFNKRFFPKAVLVLITIGGCASPQEKAADEDFYRRMEAMTPQAMAGDRKVQRELCSKYLYSNVGWETRNNEEAMRWCLPSAREGNAWAEYQVGWLLANRFRQDYAYYPEYQSVKNHKGRWELAIYWLRRSEKHGYPHAKAQADKAEEWYRKEYGTPKEDWLGKIAVAAAGVAIIGGAPSGALSSADKARLATGYVSDVMTDGKGRGIQGAAQDIQNGRTAATVAIAEAAGTPGQNGGQAQATRSATPLKPASSPSATSTVGSSGQNQASASGSQKAQQAISSNTSPTEQMQRNSEKRWNYVRDYTFDGNMSASEADGCARAKSAVEKGALIPDVKRLVSSEPCTCEDISNLAAKAYHCTIRAKLEVSSPYDPNAKYGDGKSQGTSR